MAAGQKIQSGLTKWTACSTASVFADIQRPGVGHRMRGVGAGGLVPARAQRLHERAAHLARGADDEGAH